MCIDDLLSLVYTVNDKSRANRGATWTVIPRDSHPGPGLQGPHVRRRVSRRGGPQEELA